METLAVKWMATVAMMTLLACTRGTLLHAGEVPLVFNSAVMTPLPLGYFPTMFKARDLDGDGFPDLVVAGRDPEHRLITLKGTGTGAFTPMQTLVAEKFVDWLDLADVDGDGRVDIVAAWRGDVPRVVVYRGLAAGVFEEAVVVASIDDGTGRDPQGVALGDFDVDGDVDIAISSYVGQSVEVFANITSKGSALSFERVTRVRLAQFFGGYGYPRVLATADLNADGLLDLVANEIGGSRVAVLLNHAGRFTRGVEYRAPQIGKERPGIAGLALADVDLDGDIDAYTPALLINGEQKIVLFKNDGAGRFSEVKVGSGSPSGYAFSVALADLDGDADLDAICGAAIPGTITVKRCTSSVDFTFEEDVFIGFGSLVRHVDAIDYDLDCDLDMIVIDGPANVVYTRRNATPQAGCGGVAQMQGTVKQDAPPTMPRFECPQIPSLDRNEDGVIDGSDTALWLAQWSRTTREVAPISAKGTPR